MSTTKYANKISPERGSVPNKNERNTTKQLPEPVEQKYRLPFQGSDVQLEKSQITQKEGGGKGSSALWHTANPDHSHQ